MKDKINDFILKSPDLYIKHDIVENYPYEEGAFLGDIGDGEYDGDKILVKLFTTEATIEKATKDFRILAAGNYQLAMVDETSGKRITITIKDCDIKTIEKPTLILREEYRSYKIEISNISPDKISVKEVSN